MLVWVIAALALVVGIKYYTSFQMRNLERRLNVVKDSLHETKGVYTEAQTKQEDAAVGENHHEERIRFMKEIIQNIQIRLTSSNKPEETKPVE